MHMSEFTFEIKASESVKLSLPVGQEQKEEVLGREIHSVPVTRRWLSSSDLPLTTLPAQNQVQDPIMQVKIILQCYLMVPS